MLYDTISYLSQGDTPIYEFKNTVTVNFVPKGIKYMPSYKQLIYKALSLRKKYIDQTTTNVYRLVNSYGDALPEVTVDVYDKNLLVQYFKLCNAPAMEEIYSALNEILAPD